ncbi:MAG: transporter substrate-binding domain-containing protein, partial [Pseudomonadota bacterium]|nr:transporter substrate-binding domain-containing protein [Pseudomonadota bacterium]MEC8129540.1 transporter substrate-binding domain-containing protein [Pseudomonadota bacterium]
MSITEERDKVIDFTQDYIPPSPSLFVALSGASVDLKGGVIAAQTATIQAGFIAASGATLVEFATPDETIQAVRNGEADAVLADGDYLMPIVGESNGELAVVGQESIGGGVGMGIRESDGELKAKMDKAIGTMKADGTLNTMIKKWFGDEANTF